MSAFQALDEEFDSPYPLQNSKVNVVGLDRVGSNFRRLDASPTRLRSMSTSVDGLGA